MSALWFECAKRRSTEMPATRLRAWSALVVTAATLLALSWPAAPQTDPGGARSSFGRADLMRFAQTGAAQEIVLLPNRPPQRSGERDPSSRALIETWLAGYGWNKDKRFDRERYEIVGRRVVRGEFGRAILQFRVLPLEGDAMALAARRCPGRNRPIEMQIYFQWSADNKLWTALANRGDPGFEPCSNDKLWTDEQLELIVNPPPLPLPPKITRTDVVTPPPGSPERKAIMDGLRPTFEKAFGKPVEFKVESLRVAAGFAWVEVHPQRPNGKQISKTEWDTAVGPCDQDPAGSSHNSGCANVAMAGMSAGATDFVPATDRPAGLSDRRTAATGRSRTMARHRSHAGR